MSSPTFELVSKFQTNVSKLKAAPPQSVIDGGTINTLAQRET